MNDFICDFEEKRIGIAKGFFARNLFYLLLLIALVCDLINYSYNNPELVTIGNIWYLFVCIVLVLPQVLEYTIKIIKVGTSFTIGEDEKYIELSFINSNYASLRRIILIKDVEKVKYYKWFHLITIRGSITKSSTDIVKSKTKEVTKRGRLVLLKIRDENAVKMICSNEFIKVEVIGGKVNE